MKHALETLRAEIVAVQRAGDYLKEYDLAQAALKRYPDDEYFRYCSVLALSRCNAKQRALEAFYSYRLHLSHDEYVRSLEARILKDIAFQGLDSAAPFDHLDREKFEAAALTYQREFDRTGGHYAAVNAATLYLLSGHPDKSRALAEQALAIAKQDHGAPYFALATQAESCLLLQRLDEAAKAVSQAASHNEKNLLTRARTYFQLDLICRYLHIDRKILAPLLPETVIHYCGHAFYNHHPINEADEHELSRHIERMIATHHCAVAYGSLMAGSDILFAEAILKQGGELNVWLPFGIENFCEVSVRPAGSHWVRRFHNCINAASTVSLVTDSDFLGDEALFHLCSDVAMGMAIMRAGTLNTKAMQLAVWNQNLSNNSRGTYSNISKWQALGHRSEIIPSPPIIPRTERQKRRSNFPALRREPKAILFSDVRGYSKLCDRDILWYFGVLNPALAAVIQRYQSDVEHVDTWGDAIFLVTAKAATAARIAMELNAAIANLDQEGLSIDEPLQMRIGLHYGPVYKVYDHLAQCFTFSSHDVTKTARIEPVTPPGEIFGTEPFVAMLEMEGNNWVSPEYAGTISSAKNFGEFRMFHIRSKTQDAALVCSLEQADPVHGQ